MKKYHFIGIGGAGMAPLAELALNSGAEVSGSDMELNAKTRRLQALGIKVFEGHRAENLPDDTEVVVYSSAVPESNPERQRAAALAVPQIRRGEFLGRFAGNFKRSAAVSGSHGKSSITAMLVKILEECGMEPGFLIGAARPDGESASYGSGDIFVAEVDESDGTHTCIDPYLGIVPNIDGDHEWSVGGAAQLEENFRTFGKNCRELLIAGGGKLRDFYSFRSCREVELPASFAGFHGFMAANAAMAVEAAVMLGVERQQAIEAVKKFQGIERRMQLLNTFPDGSVAVEDYAHHPAEVRSSITLLRHKYPGRFLHIVFQPHRYARLERFFPDFADVLKAADGVTVVPVFAAWSESGSRSSADLAEQLPNGTFFDGSWEELYRTIRQDGSGKVWAVLGAGDISHLSSLLKQGGE